MAQYFFLMDFWWSKTIAEDKFWICTFCSKFEGIFQNRVEHGRRGTISQSAQTTQDQGSFFATSAHLILSRMWAPCYILTSLSAMAINTTQIMCKSSPMVKYFAWDLANKLIREGCKRIMMMMTAAMGTMCCGGWDKINPWSVAANSRNRRREHLNSIFTPRWV